MTMYGLSLWLLSYISFALLWKSSGLEECNGTVLPPEGSRTLLTLSSIKKYRIQRKHYHSLNQCLSTGGPWAESGWRNDPIWPVTNKNVEKWIFISFYLSVKKSGTLISDYWCKQFSNLDSILWKYFLKNFKLGKCISQEKVIFWEFSLLKLQQFEVLYLIFKSFKLLRVVDFILQLNFSKIHFIYIYIYLILISHFLCSIFLHVMLTS